MRRGRLLLLTAAGLCIACLAVAMTAPGPLPGSERHLYRTVSLKGDPSTKVVEIALSPLVSLGGKMFGDGKYRWRDVFSGGVWVRTVRNGRSEWIRRWSVALSGTNEGRDVTLDLSP